MNNKLLRIITFLACTFLTVAHWAYAQEIPIGEPLAADTPSTTVLGNSFVAPAEWSLSTRGPATFIEAPEGGSRIVLVDVEADDADEALAKGWAAYKEITWPLRASNDAPDRDGWSNSRRYRYQTSPNEKRGVIAGVMFANDVWTVWIYDIANEVGGIRGAQVNLILGSLLPKGESRESFAGLKANKINEDRLAELTGFIESALKITGIPGVGLGIIQDGEVVFADGMGVRELGKPEQVDAETLFMVASNTKAMTTLMLARLVDEGKLTWKTPVTELMPTFRLGDDDTTSRVLIEHLVCACTGLPRKDMEFILEFGGRTANDAMEGVAATQPTSDFGEIFQYSNGLAAAAGYVGGHVAFPELELGSAYDKAMQKEVFDPLEMYTTTFDYDLALETTNHAEAHGVTLDGEPAFVVNGANRAVVHMRPAGAAWSNVNDMLKFVQMELNEGVLPDGKPYLSKDALLERRVAKVPTAEKAVYGMGLMVDNTYGTPIIGHGGSMFGYYSQMLWLPEHGVGAVILTNGSPGWVIHGNFQRKLLEVLFDGNPEADAALESGSQTFFERTATNRKLYTVPADSIAATALAAQYGNESLGKIAVSRNDSVTVFDFGEWRSEVATQKNPDGTISFVTIDPGVAGLVFVVGSSEERQLILRDAQHEYVFDEI